jgi:hypothetical protein
MSPDPKDATGRTLPAQAPEAPRIAATASPTARPLSRPRSVPPELGAVAGTGAPGAGLGSSAYAGPPDLGAWKLADETGHPPLAAVTDVQAEQERMVLAVLRLIDRVIGPGTLSPVEHAFVAGAKVMFDQLSAECARMLERKVSDVAHVLPPPARALEVPDAVPDRRPRESEVAAPKKSRAPRTRKKKTETTKG